MGARPEEGIPTYEHRSICCRTAAALASTLFYPAWCYFVPLVGIELYWMN